MEPFWTNVNKQSALAVKYEGEASVPGFTYCTDSHSNISTSATAAAYSEDDAEYATVRRNKSSRQDPLSHRIIEKRRRDRMNSCLADLSHLIPSHYQRKGRGRIEKTEIIEMAIRYLKHLQIECSQKESEYSLGYTDCMKEAAKFLFDCELHDAARRMLTHLQDHIEHVTKSSIPKLRSNQILDNVSASSRSPQQTHRAQNLNSCGIHMHSDIEYSMDQNDVKDLSFRGHLNQLENPALLNGLAVTNTKPEISSHIQPSANLVKNVISTPANTVEIRKSNNTKDRVIHPAQLASVVTSIETPILQHHTEAIHNDLESPNGGLLLTDNSNMHSPHLVDSQLNSNCASSNNQVHSEGPLPGRLRNLSESSHDVEHNNNYKYKNYIKERFNHELHDDEASSEQCLLVYSKLHSEHSTTLSDHSKDGTEPELFPTLSKKRKLVGTLEINSDISFETTPSARPKRSSNSIKTTKNYDENTFSFSNIKTELLSSSNSSNLNRTDKPNVLTHEIQQASRSVPIFVLHANGTYYVPMTIDANVLLENCNGTDFMEKSHPTIPVLHPININVCFVADSIVCSNAISVANMAKNPY